MKPGPVGGPAALLYDQVFRDADQKARYKDDRQRLIFGGKKRSPGPERTLGHGPNRLYPT
jgi:hypothetical protein